MREDTLTKVTASLKDKYPELGLERIDINDTDGTASFYLQPTNKTLAFLDGKGKMSGIIPRMARETAATISRDSMDRTALDLALQRDAYDMTPRDAYERAIRLYYTEPIVGSTVNILANIARKGFENDIDDENIKNFFDVWAFDVNFEEMLEWVYLDLFKVGQVYTYKVISAYEPRVSYLSPVPGQKIKNGGKAPKKAKGVEKGAAKKLWSKGHLPISYTVLNPLLVEVEGSLLFDKYSIEMTLPPELGQMIRKDKSKLSEDEKELIKALPADLKRAAESGGSFKLDSRLVGTISYRKQPYERYAKPRLARVFDSLEYKKALKQADLSTLDGITNYILKITIGSDDFPVTTQVELETVAELFNTPSKSFDVVWNHTLNIEKIVSPEIENILGREKYEQVNEDITGGLGMAKALLDGTGDMSTGETNMFIKGLEEEIAYARRLVTKWIYREYRLIAEAMGFDRFPKIRWDESVLKDQILYMNILAQLVDRRMLSYQTAHELLGFDYKTELQNMENEFALVDAGIFGIIGSPWQQAQVQPGQGAPKGTPSGGRPKGAPAKKRTPSTQPQKRPGQKPKNPPKKAASSLTLKDAVKDMGKEEFSDFIGELYVLRHSEEEE